MELPKTYDFKVEEPKWQRFWEEKGVYKFDPKSDKEVYSVDTPPPTISGKMHLGHAFSYAQQDCVVRFHRMLGKNVFYPFGTDDNGLATERMIEELKGVKSTKMERKEYVKLCLLTLQEIRPKCIADWKRIGMSCDWSIYYTTIDPHCQRISQKSFIELYKAGREYQKEAPTIWCPHCHTAIAQVELEDRELTSFFNDVVFKLEDGSDLIIATTRPELLPSCVGIFFHPDDDRYKKLKGKSAKVPLFNQQVPILPDERAEPEKGTGIVMCCTFGDQTDIEWYKAHNLPLIMSITEDGRMSERAGKYKGLTIKEAREKIIEDLKKAGLLLKQEKISHTVNVHERCGTEVEILNTKQWFIKYLDLKESFLKAGKQMKWFPPYMRVRYDNWIKGLQWDWCISRQRHFGVPFPVWYCKKCAAVILAELDQLPVDPLVDKPKKPCKCGSKLFVPEKDVLDTWATSSLTPQIAAELFREKGLYDKLYPMNLRPQAHDIITFWLFNTVVKSQLHAKTNPWKDIMISGFALDPHGKKMSKSRGNIVEPQAVIEQYGADCLRFWAAGSRLGEDLPYQEKDLVTGRKMIIKLWNASRFTISHLQDYGLEKPKLQQIDRWILSKFNSIIKLSTDTFNNYEYFKTKSEVEKFFWGIFCDNYLEMIKERLYKPEVYGKEAKLSAQYTLYTVLLGCLKLMAPIMPHITEAIYQLYFAKKEGSVSIHISKWPEFDKAMIDKKAEEAGDMAVDIIAAVRKFKSEHDKPLNYPVKKLEVHCERVCKPQINALAADIKATTKAEELDFGKQVSIACERFPIEVGVVLEESKK